jgi:NAD(P)-dependent dehydrogenase (short-subunit alcohol dehydrogenase family)
VGVENDVVRAFARVREAWQGLDGLVNCAAVFEKATVRQMSLATWQNMLQVNLTGTFLCCREAFRIMTAGGAIVNVASLSGVPGVEKFPGFAAYNVSKYGVVGLTEILAVEGASLGLRVNCVSPGAVDTAMLKQAAPQLPPAMHPREVAPVGVFLLSEASGVVNGANLVLQGAPQVGPGGGSGHDLSHTQG